MSPRWLVLVNQIEALEPEQMTTLLLRAAVARGVELWLTGVADLELADSGQVEAQARQMGAEGLEALGRLERLELTAFDRVVVRTNPARDGRAWAHGFALQALESAELAGATVVNAPLGLRRLGNKPGCLLLPPAIRPRTRITRSLSAVRAFARAEGRCVVKPAHGTHGRGVFVVDAADPNLGVAAELLGADGLVVAQEWLPEAVDGDVRLFLLDGQVLRADGLPAVVRRRPAHGELRSNVHLGGVPEAVAWDEPLRRVAELAGPVLRAHGVRVAGLDVIGGKVVECNVFAPGGLQACTALYGADFLGALIDGLCAPEPPIS